MSGTSDFELVIDNEPPSEDFMNKHVGVVVKCPTVAVKHDKSSVTNWVPRGEFTRYSKAGVRMALVTHVCPYCGAEHIGRIFTDADYNINRIEFDDGKVSRAMFPLRTKRSVECDDDEEDEKPPRKHRKSDEDGADLLPKKIRKRPKRHTQKRKG